MVDSIKKVTVLGSGQMGRQIGMQIALSGYDVVIYDISQGALNSAEQFADMWLKGQVKKGRLTLEQTNNVRGRLSFTVDQQSAAKEADLIVEAVLDIAEVKRNVLQSWDAITPERTIFASNSSYIISSRFADAVNDSSKVINVHFFNPALVMKVVEVVKGPHVSKETFETMYQFVQSLGKTPIIVEKEIYGFIVNRIFSALTREACYLVDMGIASPEEIDKAVKGALGHAMGPLETLDMTGLDLEYQVYMDKFRASGDKRDLPAACLGEHFAKGEFGRKSGKGFYTYEK